ncbi:alpha/beta fold hydrolase [Cystobacter fuscus]|nr:alpha/beta hydrolase [Cystobacter fuscus]
MVTLSQGLRVDGCLLRYADSGGEGTPIVFTHGAGADHHMFDAQYDRLAMSGHRVVVWDMRGHGASRPNGEPFTGERACRDLIALIEHLRLFKPVLAGLSLGGNLSQAAVRRSPGSYRALIVMGATWNTGPLTATERFLLKLAAPSLALVPESRLPLLMARASAVTSAAREDAVRAFAQMSKPRFIEVWKATVGFVTPEPSYRTPLPLCLIRGAADETGNIATAMPRWAAAEGITEHVVPNAGHLVSQDAPEAVTAIIERFVSTLPRA